MNLVKTTISLALWLMIFATASLKNAAAGIPSSQARSTTVIVDGALNPEMIPDWRAYSLLFRLVSDRYGHELAAIRAYLQQIGLGGEYCQECSSSRTDADEQISILIAIGQEFTTEARNLDASLRDAAQQNSGFDANVELRRAQQQEKLCLESISYLRQRLGSVDAEKVHRHIKQMKQKMKIVK